MKTKLVFSLLLLAAGLVLVGKAIHTVWILCAIEYHGGHVAPRWVPIVCLLAALGLMLSVGGFALLLSWWRARLADKTQRPSRVLEWFHLRFKIRRPGGTPWHGLKKFDARTAANILLAGRKKSAFAEVFEFNAAVAEDIISQAYEGRTARQIQKSPSALSVFGLTPVHLASEEAVEIYSPKP